MKRAEFIERLKEQPETIWDIIIIGGGATGMGIALDGASRGYKVLLLEQSDFGKGTSSRSTKLVHGGVRYMAQGDLLLVREALQERGIMLSNAPHLVHNQPFIIPVYSVYDAVKFTLGLKFYDILAGSLSFGKSYFISKEKTLQSLPQIKSDGLVGGIVYHDGQFDDSRMVISLAHASVNEKAVLLNYFKVTGMQKDNSGKIAGVIAMDMISCEEFSLRAKLVINATGVFADQVVSMDNPAIERSIRPSQGVHIVVDRSFLKCNTALMIPQTIDGRVLFAIPWYDKVVIGTTDTPVDNIDLEPVALEQEVSFILNTAGEYLVSPPGRKDILCIYAGLRPLAADNVRSGSTKEISRRHKITFSPSGLLTIIGGKWTTYRRMAEESIDLAIRKGFLPPAKCRTKHLKLTEENADFDDNRYKVYNRGQKEILNLISQEPETATLIDERLPYTRAEMVWICRNEMPVTIEDLLARRTRALFLDALASIDIAAKAAAIMAKELNHDIKWQATQVEAFREVAGNYISHELTHVDT